VHLAAAWLAVTIGALTWSLLCASLPPEMTDDTPPTRALAIR